MQVSGIDDLRWPGGFAFHLGELPIFTDVDRALTRLMLQIYPKCSSSSPCTDALRFHNELFIPSLARVSQVALSTTFLTRLRFAEPAQNLALKLRLPFIPLTLAVLINESPFTNIDLL